jgi:hypothetical protein
MLQNLNQKGVLFFLALAVLTTSLNIPETYAQAPDTSAKAKPAEWFRKVNIRGYAQLRYNRLLETNPDLGCDQCDKSWGGDNGFFFRRIRIIFFGQIHERVYFYIQPDFASSPQSGSLNFGQIRDAYFDVGLDKKNEFRLRIGQSKVPFGFENLQSSQNRVALDRNDGLNSALSNERDIGIFGYWAPTNIRERFSYLVSSGLKGSGDYGVIGGGVYNGQTANRNESNDQLHVVARVTYPFQAGKQFIEPGIQAYSGKVVVGNVGTGVQGTPGFEYLDRRLAATLVIYPQPFGFSSEVNVGTGPEYNPATNTIEQQELTGGYLMGTYMFRPKGQVIVPFVRYQFYDGGKKHELDARSYSVRDLELGVEWQPWKPFEVVATYTISERRYEDHLMPQNEQAGNLLRLQFQVNF